MGEEIAFENGRISDFQGLPQWTIAWTVSSELLGVCVFPLIFSFLCRVLD